MQIQEPKLGAQRRVVERAIQLERFLLHFFVLEVFGWVSFPGRRVGGMPVERFPEASRDRRVMLCQRRVRCQM